MSLDTLLNRYPPASLSLADGSVFSGVAIGADGVADGEVVFNTSMTGYQEILTDPSYARQIVALTYPHIGNVGVNPFDVESESVHVAGLVIRDLSQTVSNWRSAKSLEAYLKQNGIIAIANVDTRRLTRLLRDKGAQSGSIVVGKQAANQALERAKAFRGLEGVDLAKEVSTNKKLEWTQGTFHLDNQRYYELTKPRFHVVAYDFGVKAQILQLLVDRGCRIALVPAQTPVSEVLALQPDGLLLSNGPGDPAACDYAIAHIRELLIKDIPMLGICLGFQLLALAHGANTVKMKFGHHGVNHPVQELATGRVSITSQNHGFAVEDETLPEDLQVTHRSLFDGTLQGFQHRTKPILGFQGHPEASPGPEDIQYLFDRFIQFMEQ